MSQNHQNITSISKVSLNNAFDIFKYLLDIFVKYDVAVVLNKLTSGIRAV